MPTIGDGSTTLTENRDIKTIVCKSHKFCVARLVDYPNQLPQRVQCMPRETLIAASSANWVWWLFTSAESLVSYSPASKININSSTSQHEPSNEVFRFICYAMPSMQAGHQTMTSAFCCA